MGERPQKCTLDRIDCDGNYTPTNCAWATASRQSRNRRDRRQYTFQGRTMGLSDWAEALNMDAHVLGVRINSYHWDIERAFTTPRQKHTT